MRHYKIIFGMAVFILQLMGCKEETQTKPEPRTSISQQDLKSDFLLQEDRITQQYQAIQNKFNQCREIAQTLENENLACNADDPFTTECHKSASNLKGTAKQARNCAYELQKYYEELAEIYDHITLIAQSIK